MNTLRQTAIELLKSTPDYVTEHWPELDEVVKALTKPDHAVDLLFQSAQEGWRWAEECEAEVRKLKALLAQPENEPVAWINWNGFTGKRSVSFEQTSELADEPLYAVAPKREWIGLTDDEIIKWWESENGLEDCVMSKLFDFAKVVRTLQAKLKEKNT